MVSFRTTAKQMTEMLQRKTKTGAQETIPFNPYHINRFVCP